MNSSNKVAILVLCNSQRLFELNQLIEWLVVTDFYGDLILLDRGPQYMSIGNLSHDSEIWSGRIKLIPTDTEAPSSNRLLEGLAHTDKPYIAHLADDDFMMGDVLAKSAKILDDFSDVATSGGYTYWINSAKNNSQIFFKPYSTKSFLEDDIFKRLADFSCNYNHLIYCLMRRESFFLKHKLLEDYSDPCFWQYANSLISVVIGKAKFINEIGHVRCTLPGGSRIMFKEKSRDAFPHILLSPDFPSRLNMFRQKITECAKSVSVKFDEAYLDELILYILGWAFCGMRVDQSFEKNMSKNLVNQVFEQERLTDLGKRYQMRVDFHDSNYCA